MEQFAYSFAITMMHSIWQMALLLLFYYAVVYLFKNWPPLAKRNLLLFLLGAQLLSSAISFYFIHSNPFTDYRETVQALLQSLSTPQSILQQYSPLLLSLYAFGLFYKVTLAWFNWKKFNSFYKSSLIKPSVELRMFTEAKAIHFGIKRKVKIWCSEHIQSPVTFGFLKPVILLPVALVNQLNLQQTESLIVHELTHIKNNDYIFNWILLVTDAIFFFNPFVKIALQKIKIEREKNCDVQVLQFNYPAIGYAEALLFIAQQQHLNAALVPVSAVNKKTELLDRIRFFSDDKNINTVQAKYFSLSALMIWSFIAANIFFAAVFISQPNKQSLLQPANSFAATPVNEWNKAFSTAAVDDVNDFESTTPTQNNSAEEAVATVSDALPAEEESMATAVETDYKETPAPIASASIKLIPVSFNGTPVQPEVVKEVIIAEESNGVTVTKVFRMTSSNGEFKMEPLWMISEVKPSDSLALKIKADSSIYMMIPTVQ